MNLIDPSIERRGFAPASIGLAVRSIGSCFAACHRPDSRILTGIGMLNVAIDDSGYSFSADARCLSEGDSVVDVLDWLETHLPSEGAIVSWPNWGSVPKRLAAIADAQRHPRIVSAAADTHGRWRDMPKGHVWHLKQARAHALPCLCGPHGRVDDCDAAMPSVLLPDPVTTAHELIGEAIAGWQCWVQAFGDFDDELHPAQAALRALDKWRADRRQAS
jgi:hypothetical protein